MLEKYKTLHCDCVISMIVYFRCLSLKSINALKFLEHRSVQNSISIPFRSHLERQPEIKGLEEFHLENKDTRTRGKTTTKHRIVLIKIVWCVQHHACVHHHRDLMFCFDIVWGTRQAVLAEA